MEAGKVYIFTGTGKGKSSAALGLSMRKAAKGKQVIFIQFLKSGEIAESELFKRLEPQIRFFRFEKSGEAFEKMSEEERREETENLRNGLHFAKKVLDTAVCDILVMDEVLGLIDNHIITLEELKNIVDRRGDTAVIITGVSMTADYCSIADEISEIRTVDCSHE